MSSSEERCPNVRKLLATIQSRGGKEKKKEVIPRLLPQLSQGGKEVIYTLVVTGCRRSSEERRLTGSANCLLQYRAEHYRVGKEKEKQITLYALLPQFSLLYNNEMF